MPIDSYVQVAPDSSGAKVRNLESGITLPTGAEHTVKTQVATLVGPDGKLVDADTSKVLSSLNEMRETLEDILDVLTEAFGSDTRQALSKKGGRHFSMISRRR